MCDELLKTKDGKGSLSQIIAAKENIDATKPPLPGDLGSITTPPNAVISLPKVKLEKNRHNIQPKTKNYIDDKWYYIGKPN